jgi:hypothetical protein
MMFQTSKSDNLKTSSSTKTLHRKNAINFFTLRRYHLLPLAHPLDKGMHEQVPLAELSEADEKAKQGPQTIQFA